MVREKGQEYDQESDHEAFPDFRHDAHDFLESHIAPSVNGCNGVHHGGSGKEGKYEEESEACGLEEIINGPLGG